MPARCVHCKQWTWPRQPEFSLADLTHLFTIWGSWGLRTVTFGGGNPLLHPNFCASLDLARANGIECGVITEGAGLAEEMVDAICRDAQWIRFSLDGPNAEIHDSIRNSPGLYDCVVSSIQRLKARSPRLPVGLNCVVQKQNIAYVSQMADVARQLGPDALLFKIPHGQDGENCFLPSLEGWNAFMRWLTAQPLQDPAGVRTNVRELGALLGSMLPKSDVIRGRPASSYYVRQKARCFVPLFFLTCDSRGNMYPCDYLQADTRLYAGEFGRCGTRFVL